MSRYSGLRCRVDIPGAPSGQHPQPSPGPEVEGKATTRNPRREKGPIRISFPGPGALLFETNDAEQAEALYRRVRAAGLLDDAPFSR